GLEGLQRAPGDDVADRDLAERVPEVREPAADVPAQQLRGCADHEQGSREVQEPAPAETALRARFDCWSGDAHRPRIPSLPDVHIIRIGLWPRSFIPSGR